MNNTNNVVQQAVTTLALSFALFYANFKMAVFPVHFVMEGGSCSCGNPACANVGKHPMTNDGFKSASSEQEKVRWFFTGEPDANVGVRTGAESGIVVLDVDPRHGGDQSLAQLFQEHGPFPATVVVRTGGGGWHYYFAHPGQGHTIPNRQNLRPGLDLRGDGGYVLGAGSNHVHGEYAFADGYGLHQVQLAPIPKWLMDVILGAVEASPATCGTEGALGKGERHPVLFALAGAMRQKGMSRAGIEAALKAENVARCNPPLDEKEITKMVAGVMKYPAGALPKGRFHSALPREEVVRDTIQAFETAADPKVTSHEVNWLVRGYVAQGAITLLTGRAKASGKSTFVSHMLARVLDGHHFLGQLTQKTGVVYLTEERDTFTEVLKRSGLLGRSEFKFLRYDPARDATFAEQIAAARQVAKEIGAKILVVDTIAQFLALRGDTENEAGAALEALKPLQEAAREGLAVIAVHHEKKGSSDVGDGGRGSSAFAGAVDIIVSLRRPEGQTSPGVRVLHALSRFPATPTVQYVELTEHGYEPRDEGGVVTAAAEKVLLQNAPASECEALPISTLIQGTEIKEPTARKAAKKLVTEGSLKETGDGVKGSPRKYWKAPPADSDTTHTP
jgi:putative DNA primase/helicase